MVSARQTVATMASPPTWSSCARTSAWCVMFVWRHGRAGNSGVLLSGEGARPPGRVVDDTASRQVSAGVAPVTWIWELDRRERACTR